MYQTYRIVCKNCTGLLDAAAADAADDAAHAAHAAHAARAAAKAAAEAAAALGDDKSRRVCVILTFNLDEPTQALIAGRKRIPTEVTKDIAGEVVVGMRVEDLMIAGLPVFEEAEAQAKR